jgi:hypothetical protein
MTLPSPTPSLRALPVPVRPVDGETPDSYFRRLAPANALTLPQLWAHIRAANEQLPYKQVLHRAAHELEALGGLPPDWFQANRAHHLLPVRCPHNRWRMRVCTACSRPPAVRAGCTRCAGGTATQVASRTGAICLRHRQWVHGTHLDISGMHAHFAAERLFRAVLHDRGIGLETGELQLADSLLSHWSREHAAPAPSLPTDGHVTFFQSFPQIVRLAVTLTDPRFTSSLLDPHWSPSQQALLLSRAITEITRQPPSDSALDELWAQVYTGRRAVEAAFGMLGRRQKRKCAWERALCAAAHTHRACLLRHLDAKVTRPRTGALPLVKAPSAAATVRSQHPWTR